MASFTERLKQKGASDGSPSFTQRVEQKKKQNVYETSKGDKKDYLLEKRNDIPEPEPQKTSVNSFIENMASKNSGKTPIDIRSTPSTKANKTINRIGGQVASTTLDVINRPTNAVINTIKESGSLKQNEYANIGGKLYPKTNGAINKKDIGGAFIRGITGEDRPQGLEVAFSKETVEDLKKKAPAYVAGSNLVIETLADPTNYAGVGTIKKLISNAKIAKAAKGVTKIDDALKTELKVQNLLDNEMAKAALKGSKEIPKFKQYADGSISPQVTYDAVRNPISYADGNIGEKVDILKKPVFEFESAKPKQTTTIGSKTDTMSANLGGKAELPKVGRIDQTLDGTTIPTGGKLPQAANRVIMDTAKDKFSFKKAWDKFYTSTVDTQKPITDFARIAGDDTATLASNSRNAGGTVDYILKDALVDRQGNKIGKSLKEVAEQIPKGKEDDFWNYLSQRHNIDRAREGNHVIANYTSEMSERAVKEIETANPAYKSIGDDVTNWIDSFMKEWGVNAGTVDSTVYDSLRQTYKSYFPTQREFSQLEKSIPDGARKQFVDNSTTIKAAKGSERDINNPLENIMNLVNRNVKTARYNQVGQSLLESVRKAPDKLKELAEVIPTQDGMFANTDNVISVLESGKPVYLQINNKELLDSLKGLPKVVNNAKVMRAFTNTFKGLITQKNPLFAIRNIARDIPTAYIYGSTKNPVKFGVDLAKAGKDILSNSPKYQQYRGIGGGGANFFKGDAVKSTKELTKNGFHPLKAIETFNNITETAPRLAEFNRIFERTGDVQKALDAANNVTVNFARGGNVTKTAEPFIPYLNAGVQGLDRFFKGFKDTKTAAATLLKGGIAITAPEIALYMVNKDNPNYQALDNRTKDTYFLIPKENGTFWKIPKSRELGVLFGSLFQRAMRAADGDKEAFKGFGMSLATSFAPANPIDNNIAAPIFNLKSNKDFAGRNIVPQGMVMDGRSPYLQSDEKTTEIAKAIGTYSTKVIDGGLSPKQIDYLIKSYTGVIGQLGMPLATQGASQTKAVTTQFTADPLYSNQALQNFYDNYDKLQREATDKNIVEKLPTNGKENVVTPEEEMRNKFSKASTEISKTNKEIKALEASLTNDKESKVRVLRQKILDIANEANKQLK